MLRFVEFSAHTRPRATLRVVQRSILALALAGCSEAPTARTAAELASGQAPGQPPTVLSRIACVAKPGARSVSCGSDVANAAQLSRSSAALPGSATPDIILGGQNSYVKLTSSNVSYAGEVFSFDATVTNLLDQPIGTTNGSTLDPNGIRVFFENPPQTLTGAGVIDFINPVGGGSLVDGFATFTQSNQAFYRYNQILATNQTSAARNWKLHVPLSAESFQFFVYVSAPVQYAQGSIRTVVEQQPVGGVTGDLLSTPVAIKVVGATGATKTGYTGDAFAFLVSGNGALSGTTVRPVVNGVVVFDDLRVIGTGSFRLGLAADGTNVVLSLPFTVGASSSPGISFQSINDADEVRPVNLVAVDGSIDVVLRTQGTVGVADLFLSSGTACSTDVVGSGDVAVGSGPTAAGVSTVTLNVNTMELTAGKLPRFPNGTYCLKARLHETSQDSYASRLALTLTNGDTFIASAVFSGPSAVGINGESYDSGDLTVTVTPVNFENPGAAPVATMSVALGNPARTLSLVPVGGTPSFTGVYSSASVSSNTIGQYQTVNPTGDLLRVASAVNTAGAVVSHNDSLATLYVDNQSPQAPILHTTPGYPGNPCTIPNGLPCTNYVSANYVFAVTAATLGDPVSTVTVTFGVRANDAGYVALPGASAITPALCSTAGWTLIDDASSLPSTPTSNAFRLRRFDTDAIGNVRCTDYPNPFGVDRIAPLITATDGTALVIGANTTLSYSVADTISGFIPSRPLEFKLQFNFAGCLTPAGPVDVPAAPADGCFAQTSASGLIINPSPCAQGYYTTEARAVDQGGNRSPSIIRTFVYDNTPPVLEAVSVPATLIAGVSTTFTSAATDNVDLRAAGFTIEYGGGLLLGTPANDYGPTFDATRVTSAPVNATTWFTFTQMQRVDGNGAPTVPLTSADLAQNVSIRAIDAANNISAPATASLVGHVTGTPGFTTADFNRFHISNLPQSVSNDNGSPQQVNLTASVVIDNGGQQPNQPLTLVCFYYFVTAPAGVASPIPTGAFAPAGCTTNPSVIDNAITGTRTWVYAIGFDPPRVLGTSGPVNLIAVGMRANGEAIVTNTSSAITLAP